MICLLNFLYKTCVQDCCNLWYPFCGLSFFQDFSSKEIWNLLGTLPILRIFFCLSEDDGEAALYLGSSSRLLKSVIALDVLTTDSEESSKLWSLPSILSSRCPWMTRKTLGHKLDFPFSPRMVKLGHWIGGWGGRQRGNIVFGLRQIYCLIQIVQFRYCPGGYTTNLAEHTQAFLGKPGSTELQLAIRVKWYHEAHFRFN